MAATEAPLAEVLSAFTTATEAALQGLPDENALQAPEHGISLLDAKNEIFLAYIQALALRNLNIIRSIKAGSDTEAATALSAAITRQLVEQRVYLERGVKPLEQRIKYQVDKVVKASDDAERAAAQKTKAEMLADSRKQKAEEDDSDSDSSDDEAADEEADGMAFRPSSAAVFQSSASGEQDERKSKSKADGVYRPPRIAATAMPTTERKEKKERSRPHRSTTVDEYISTELSTAPMAEPSIGSTITGSGRGTKDARQLAREEERRVYEETNLVRLPKESKKNAQKRGRGRDGGYGGDEWKGLGESLHRISDLTRKKGGKDSALERSRKRRATEDGPRDSGIGNAFDVKQRRMEKRAKR